ncbi:MAG: PAS domain S-box protein [Dehalococcoidia bacterium]|nr:MAG: PAS domain S-box protein [Dehalococcoidia bacterium]
MVSRLSLKSLAWVIRRPGFWLLAVLFLAISVPHYDETLHPPFVNRIFEYLDMDRHAFERILYIVPITLSGFFFGHRGAYIASAIALGCMIPRAVMISPSTGDALFESGAIFLVGNLVGFAFASLQKERKRRMQLDALNQTSLIVSQSLELDPILNRSIDSVVGVMKVDVAQVFLVDENAGDLVLAAYRGVSREFAQGVDRLKIGEGLNGSVAQTGEPTYVRNASTDPRLTRTVLQEDRIGSMLIVPLKSKEKVMGTLCVSMRGYREFSQDEVDLLTNIGNQIGVAVDNARLYQQQKEFTEQLRASEERYRELFENAHDAIWLHDLDHNIIAANNSCVGLTGYTVEELRKTPARHLISNNSRASVEAIEDPSNQNVATGHLLEVVLVKKDGSEAYVQLSTNPIFSNGMLMAFQHIARDITQEKKMRENEQFYLQQVTIAQEEERKRIARELHDDTTQELIVLSRELDELYSKANNLSEDDKSRLNKLWHQTNSIIAGVRRLSQDLRPATLDRLGLLPSLEWIAANLKEHSGINVHVVSTGDQRRLASEQELVLFRIVQEALSNVWRHSGATTVEITVEFKATEIKITIQDNGQGFSVPDGMGDLAKEGKLGLAGMQERAKLLGGSVTVNSKPGKGTVVVVEAMV